MKAPSKTSPTPPPFTALAGVVSTFPSAAASFSFPRGVTTDGTNVYVAETNGNTIQKVVIATGVISLLAGSGTAGSSNGTAAAASFRGPNGVATDGINVFVADAGNNMIRQVVIATGKVSTLAGTGASGTNNGLGTTATFNGPSGVATDGTNVYVADQGGNVVRQIVIATGYVSTLAGTGGVGADDGPGTSATFGTLTGIATDGTNVYVADFGNNMIRQIAIATGDVSTFAGTGSSGADNGPRADATFYQPDGVATDGTYVYVADTSNNLIRQIDIATGNVTTLAGTGSLGNGDGPGKVATFNNPYQLAVSSKDRSRLFVADSYNDLIRLIQ